MTRNPKPPLRSSHQPTRYPRFSIMRTFFANSTIPSFYTQAQHHNVPDHKASEFSSAWTVNPTHTLTPYMTLWPRWSQALTNVLTVAFVMLCVVLHIYKELLIFDLQTACSLAEASQNIISLTSAPIFIELCVQSVSATLSSSLVKINNAALDVFDSRVSNLIGYAWTYIKELDTSYTAWSKTLADTAYDAAYNVSRADAQYIDSSIESAVNHLKPQLANVSQALSNLEKALSSAGVLFKSADLGSAANISLSPISSIRLPTNLNTQNLNFTFDFINITDSARSAINSVQNSVLDHRNKTTLPVPLLPALQQNNKPYVFISTAPVCAKSVHDIRHAFRINLGVLVTLCVLFFALHLSYQFFVERKLILLAQQLETPGRRDYSDPRKLFHKASNPLLSKLSDHLSRAAQSDNERSTIQFVASYVTSTNALALLVVFVFFLTSFLAHKSLLDKISLSTDLSHHKVLSNTSSTSNSLNSWTSQTNLLLNEAQNSANQRLLSLYQDVNIRTTSTLINYHKNMTSALLGQAKGSNISVQSVDALQHNFARPLNLSALSIPMLAYPLLSYANLSKVISSHRMSFSGQQPSTDLSSLPEYLPLENVLSRYSFYNNVELLTGFAMLAIWLAYLLGSILYGVYKSKYTGRIV